MGQWGGRAQQSQARARTCGHRPDTPPGAQALKMILGGPQGFLPQPLFASRQERCLSIEKDTSGEREKTGKGAPGRVR